MTTLSIVSTLYNSQKYIEDFYQRSLLVSEDVFHDIEFILVNDGSPDKSINVATSLSEKDFRVNVINLSRNFGHHKAMMTGLKYAQGDLIWLIDIDLEEQPEWLTEFREVLNNENVDCVYGVQSSRKGNAFEKITGSLFYSLINMLIGMEFPRNIVTARLMTSRYKESLCKFTESHPVLNYLTLLTGYDQKAIEVEKLSTSPTSYTLSKKIHAFVDSITSSTSAPLVGMFYLGIIIFILSLFLSIALAINILVLLNPVPGWASIIISIWLSTGLLISSLGLIGIYVSRIFIETKRRPYSIVKEIYGKSK
ncbi:glycosyltransferase family 2 protein [Prochlorococcus marinus]|uniref:glycosyltransferase family 2 protein n=1 Tax=Prochlorococcus marinus TaxID=1219 RepID=UPI0022B4FEFB|nr:glycosyltransferase family 2 protein [Prochlorococcus marinus]